MTNAIIMAAGYGKRLSPFSKYCHKSQIVINNKKNIERLIELYKKNGIEKIYIIVGHLKESFVFLTNKYTNVILIYNEKYREFNNFYSIYLAKKYLSDCYISEADLFITDAFDLPEITGESMYFVKDNFSDKKEWRVYSDFYNRILKINVEYSHGKEVSTGITYLNKRDGEFIEKKISEISLEDIKNPQTYWDEYLMNNLFEIQLYKYKVNTKEIFEIDDFEDLKILNNSTHVD